MTPDGLKELFEPFGAVAIKRMFGGHGVYAEGRCFAVESGGEVFLKVDAQSQPDFFAAGASPFIYVARGKPMTTSIGAFRQKRTTRPTNSSAGPRWG